MDVLQRKKLRRYLKLSLAVHGGLLGLLIVGKFFHFGETQLFQPSVQIDMVALPDLVKSQEKNFLDPTLPVKDAPPPPPPEPKAAEEESMPTPEAPKEVALKKDAALEAKKALERLRSQVKKKDERENEKKREELISKRQEDLKRFEETYRAAIKGNQTNQGSSAEGDLRNAMNAYQGHIQEKVRANWALPVWLQTQGLRAEVTIYLNERGSIIRYHFTRSSGNETFDDYVKGTLQKSSPFAPPPAEMARGLRNSGIGLQFPL